MNEWTARVLTFISLTVLAGYAFYLTGSFWVLFLILFFLPSMGAEDEFCTKCGRKREEEKNK